MHWNWLLCMPASLLILDPCWMSILSLHEFIYVRLHHATFSLFCSIHCFCSFPTFYTLIFCVIQITVFLTCAPWATSPYVAIVPAAQALTMVSIRSKLMSQAIYLTFIKLMICNDTRTLYFMHHETRALSYCCDVALLRKFWPMGAQLHLKAALPLALMIVTASGRCSGTGPGSKLSPLLRSLWGTFQHLISLVTHFASMGVLAVSWVLRQGVNEGTITWLDAGYARDVDCDLFRCGYNDRW